MIWWPIFRSFNNAVPTTELIKHLRWDSHKILVSRDSQGSSRYGLFHGIIPAFAWRDYGKPRWCSNFFSMWPSYNLCTDITSHSYSEMSQFWILTQKMNSISTWVSLHMEIKYMITSYRMIHRTGKYDREQKEYLWELPAGCLPRAAMEI